MAPALVSVAALTLSLLSLIYKHIHRMFRPQVRINTAVGRVQDPLIERFIQPKTSEFEQDRRPAY